MPPQPASADKALKPIRSLVASGDLYSAHQRARTTAARLLKQGDAGREAAVEVLFESAKAMLEKEEWGSGADLGCLLVEALGAKGEGAGVEPEERTRVNQLIGLTTPEGAWRKRLVDAAISWSAKASLIPSGDPDILHYIGELYTREKSFDLAEPYLLSAGKRESARLLGEVFWEWAKAPEQEEQDIGRYGLRGVWSYLLSQNLLCASVFLRSFFTHITTAFPALLATPITIPLSPVNADEEDVVQLTTSPCLNFAQLGLKTVQRSGGPRSQEDWTALVRHYEQESAVARLPSVREATAEIGAIYFDIRPRGQGGNMFDLMSSLFGGGAPGGGTQRPAAPPRRIGTEGLD